MKRRRETFLRSAPRSRVPHEFVLDALEPLSPVTKPMFGCLAVYVRDKIMVILRDRPDHLSDNGVWVATSREHHDSLRRDLPSLRSIQLFGTPMTTWQVVPAETSDFEESALRVCELVLARDPRIGRVPASRMKGTSKKRAASKTRAVTRATKTTARPRRRSR